MSYETLIGFRYLRTRKRSTFLSIITLISIVGVTLGVATLCVALSVMNGFKKELIERVVGTNAHAIVMRSGAVFTDHANIRNQIAKIPGIRSAAPIVLSEAMLSAGNRVAGVGIKGVDPRFPQHLKALRDARTNPKRDNLDNIRRTRPGQLPGIAIGYNLAHKLNVGHGDIVNLVSPISFFRLKGNSKSSHRSFRVVLIYRVGMHEYDSKFCFIDIKEAQAFFKLESSANAIELLTTDFKKLRKIKMQIYRKFPNQRLRINDWRQMNQNLFRAIEQNKVALALVLLSIILVASLNIAGTLILMVLEKSKDIAILSAMGARKSGIMRIFMTFGLYIGALGTMIGLSVGFIVCQVANRVGIKLDSSVYFISKLPIEIKPLEWIIVAVCAMLISFLATIYPAIQAAKQRPVEVLRYE